MSRVVRSSKYRHVFGQPFKKEECYDELKVTRNAWDSNYVAASPLYFGVIWEGAGGGSFAVIPWSLSGKVDPKLPLITGHKNPILDIDWNPFNDSMIASASEDCYVKIWGIPEGGLKENMSDPLQTLSGHKRKVGTVQFNPVANNVLATSSADYSVKVWDIEKGTAMNSIDAQHSDIINSSDWNTNGSLIVTTSKDKKIRVIDPRANSVVQEAVAHEGVKGGRSIWLGNKEKIFSCGFTKTSEREYAIWDPKDLSKPLNRTSVDSASGILMPFFDNDTNVLFLAGKGDGNIRYYEIVDEAPYIHYLSEYKSNTPQRGMCLVPKRAVNVSDCEIVRALKVGVKMVEPISFQVPRKSDIFQDDLYPDCYAGEPALTAEEWSSGKNENPKTRSLAPGFVAKKQNTEFNAQKAPEEKVLSEKELREEVDKLTKRVAYLEAEIIKKDARLKELSGN
eukprot:TRINITY_DN24_c0_g1_i1.p1 TRINITY_DN24_c0_g1~~TRINITY_DN24_c0_g1_i1.p1  ORF type:complete len:451 (-),score=132.88 TRINITY_DN24_c0_g1_i1:101-1453(-)